MARPLKPIDEIEKIDRPYRIDDQTILVPLEESNGDYSYKGYDIFRLIDGEWIRVIPAEATLSSDELKPMGASVKFREWT